ncbi:MAG: DUF4194 domain-containing protein, partial [Bifidobacteriaceae bacterium]|nr:DUF4194 domain-containing protein [Bifidobacteriaceae bacterium]
AHLLRGPYLSADRHGGLWEALLADQAAIESRLADLFLELVVDRDGAIAFIRGVRAESADVPQVVRTRALNFMQTALLLQLRQLLVRAAPGETVIVGLGEVTEFLDVYRSSQGIDRALLAKRAKAAWGALHEIGLLHKTTTEDRSEISPALRLVFGPEEIERLTSEYERIAAGSGGDAVGSAGEGTGPWDDGVGPGGGARPQTGGGAPQPDQSAARVGGARGPVGQRPAADDEDEPPTGPSEG